MTLTAKIRILDEVNCVVLGLQQEHLKYLREKFSVFAPNYFFHPKFKLGRWDGKIRFFHETGKTFVYLLENILPILSRFKYKCVLEDLRKTNLVHPDPITNDLFANIKHLQTNEPIVLRDFQVEAVNELIKYGYGICVASTGSGKAQPLTSKILTPTGWKTMGEIQPGTQVLTPRGTVTRVIGVFPQGEKQIYEITFHDGSKTRACADHLWKVKVPIKNHTAKTEDRIVTTQDIINFLKRKNSSLHTPGNISIPLCSPIETPHQNLPIDPYVLGVLIGNGCLTGDTVMLSNTNTELLERVRAFVSHNQTKLTFIESSRSDYRISKIEHHNSCPPTPNPITLKLKQLGLMGVYSYTKFIPLQYKSGSLHQRMELLRGLMDTDGTVDSRGHVSYTTTSHQLAKDIQQIVWSIGGTCTITHRIPSYSYKGEKKKGRVAYECHIRIKNPKELFFISEKQSKCREIHADGRIELMRRVVSVEPVGVEQAQCILVEDEQHLYITDDYIVTHNTLACAALVKAYDLKGIKSLTIVPDQTLIRQTKNEYINCQLDTGEYSGTHKDINHKHVVSTWQALKNNPKIVSLFDMVIVDECHGLRGNVLNKILTDHAANIPYRFGFTGTLPKDESDRLAVHVAVGPVRYTIGAKDLIDKGLLSNLHINIIQLEEDIQEEYRRFCEESSTAANLSYVQFKEQYFADFAAEKSYLQHNLARIEWIASYLSTIRDQSKGNILCLIDNIAFGRKLTKSIENAIFVNGQDVKKASDRQEVYDLFKDRNDLIVIATVNIAGTGLNINRIFNLVIVDIGKSFVRVIQAIGRGLRLAADKSFVNIHDICSDLKYSKKHLRQRINYYTEAGYPFKKRKIDYMKMMS